MERVHAPRVSAKMFQKILRQLCNKTTSADPNRWQQENPLWGHCAVVSVIAQEMFGGQIVRANLDPKADVGSSHYWNQFPDGTLHDFTAGQFKGSHAPIVGELSFRTSRQVLWAPVDATPERKLLFDGARKRYKLLKWRMEEYLARGNPLFLDASYYACFMEALESPCQKMRYGCRGIGYDPRPEDDYNEVVTHNHPPDVLKGIFCDPTCARLTIRSRTQSMIGDCGHAEEWALDGLRQASDIKLWIAGFYPHRRPALN